MQLPDDYPLSNVIVASVNRLGVSEGQWRKWLLQVTGIFLSQDSRVLDACLLWKRNLDKHFAGVEPCPIWFVSNFYYFLNFIISINRKKKTIFISF